MTHLYVDERISIHALREEGDAHVVGGLVFGDEFLSTPSARRATQAYSSLPCLTPISIHALREEGDGDACVLRSEADAISIHALREEGDL